MQVIRVQARINHIFGNIMVFDKEVPENNFQEPTISINKIFTCQDTLKQKRGYKKQEEAVFGTRVMRGVWRVVRALHTELD